MPVPSNLYKTSTPTASKTGKLNTQSASRPIKPIKSSTTQTSTSGSTTTTTTSTTTAAATTTVTLASTTVTQLAKTTVIKQDVVKPHLSLTSTPVSEIIIDQQQVVDNNNTTVLNQTIDTDPSSENSFIEDLLEQPNLLFYFWTIALASLLALFIFKKFKQWKRMQARQAAAAQQKTNLKPTTVQTAGGQPRAQQAQQISPKPKPQVVTGQPPVQVINLQAQQQQSTYVVVLLKMFDLLKIVLAFLFAMAKILFSWIISSTTNGDFFIPTSDTGLDNFFKWFYFNIDSTRSVNSTVLNALNETASKHQPKIGENTEDVYFKSVDILAPRFSNTKTVVNDNDSLTMKSQVQFGSVDLKLDLRRQRRQLDLKISNLTTQIKIVLSHPKNNTNSNFTLYNLDLFADSESEPIIYINQPNQPLEPHLSRLITELIKETCKQLVLTVEFNFANNKIQSNSRLMLKNPQQQHQPSPRTSLNQPLIVNTNLNKQASQSSNKSPSQLSPSYEPTRLQPSPSLHSNSQYSPKPETNSNNNNNRNTELSVSNSNTAANSPNINHSSNNHSSNLHSGSSTGNTTGNKANLTINSNESQQHQQNNSSSSMPSSPTTPSVLSPELINQLRSTLNEKQLLVKLVKTTNLASCEEPYCVVELDYPMQKHITDVCKDMTTIDEQFLFDITANSEELSFSIFDKARDYGNDLIGEAVLPVNDLCSNLTSKRVIQLHRYGQTKSGSITVEFAFLEPLHSASYDPRQANRESRVDSPISHYADKQLNQLNISTSNPGGASDNLSASYNTPQLRGTLTPTNPQSYSPNHLEPSQQQQQSHQSPGGYSAYASSINKSTQISPNRPNLQQQQQQQQAPTRVINRNYLQVQSLKRNQNNNQQSSLLASGGGSASSDITDLSDPKRTKSLSRSLKNLFVKQSPLTPVGSKREKSLDSSNMLGTATHSNKSYDAHSIAAGVEHLNKSKTIGGSLRKLFKIKNKKYQGHVHEPTTSGGGGGTLSSPSSPLMAGASPASHHHSFQQRPVSPGSLQMSPTNRQQLAPPNTYQSPPSPGLSSSNQSGGQLSYYQQNQQRDANTVGQNYAYGSLGGSNERQPIMMGRGYGSP